MLSLNYFSNYLNYFLHPPIIYFNSIIRLLLVLLTDNVNNYSSFQNSIIILHQIKSINHPSPEILNYLSYINSENPKFSSDHSLLPYLSLYFIKSIYLTILYFNYCYCPHFDLLKLNELYLIQNSLWKSIKGFHLENVLHFLVKHLLWYPDKDYSFLTSLYAFILNWPIRNYYEKNWKYLIYLIWLPFKKKELINLLFKIKL